VPSCAGGAGHRVAGTLATPATRVRRVEPQTSPWLRRVNEARTAAQEYPRFIGVGPNRQPVTGRRTCRKVLAAGPAEALALYVLAAAGEVALRVSTRARQFAWEVLPRRRADIARPACVIRRAIRQRVRIRRIGPFSCATSIRAIG